MSFVFATCQRGMALMHLKKAFPEKQFIDEGIVKEFLDMVEADILRVGDPDFHRKGQIFEGKNLTEENKVLAISVCKRFNSEYILAREAGQ